MRTRFTSVTFLISLLIAIYPHLTRAQTPVYEPFDVDAVAEPLGGQAMLETFLAANVRKPFMAQVANVSGNVVLKAVIEPNGEASDVLVIRSLRPDCDREAIRVMRLFSAWKPAIKGGRTVKQAITYSVLFQGNKPVNYEEGKVIGFFDANWKSISGIKNAKYITEMIVDTATGVPNGDLVTNELYLGQWGEANRTPLIKIKLEGQKPDQPSLFEIGYKPDGINWSGVVYTVGADSSVIQERSADYLTEQSIRYYKNGMVESIIQDEQSGQKKLTQWFENGVVQEVRISTNQDIPFLEGFSQLIDAWDSTGIQKVRKGKGYMIYRSIISSKRDLTKKTVFTEEGAYRERVKDGLWKGRTADDSFSYTERFDKGKDLGGEAIRNGKSVTYKTVMRNPEFIGGHKEMYKFLSKTGIYPSEAHRLNISGKVFVSFIVCTDGSLCDFTILKGADPYLDEEALRTVKRMNSYWQPGYERGEPVAIKYNLPVSFQLEKRQPSTNANVIGTFYMFRPLLR